MRNIALVLVICTEFFSCTMPKQTTNTPSPRLPAKFDYSPPSRVEAGSSALTVALISPVYITKKPEYIVAPFPEMSTSMNNDFEELLTAKGFKIRGPFRSRDEMVYSDKINSDFAFLVEIDLQPTWNRTFDQTLGLGGLISTTHTYQYKTKGEVTFGGNLVITATSAQYGEKIWKKNIALDKASFTYTGSVKWNNIPSVADELKQDNVFYNLVARELEKFYTQAMGLAWQQIEVEEMKTVAAQAKLADKR